MINVYDGFLCAWEGIFPIIMVAQVNAQLLEQLSQANYLTIAKDHSREWPFALCLASILGRFFPYTYHELQWSCCLKMVGEFCSFFFPFLFSYTKERRQFQSCDTAGQSRRLKLWDNLIFGGGGGEGHESQTVWKESQREENWKKRISKFGL